VAPAAADQAAADQAAPASTPPPAAGQTAPAAAVAARPAQPALAPATPPTTAAIVPPAAPAPAAPALPQTAAAQPAPPALPALTFANHEAAGCCLALGGRWHDLAQGGAPGFHGPSAWTANRAATATWNLGSPAGGRRWDSVRVLVWIPSRHATARVRFTVTATNGQGRAVRTFDVAEPGHAGWLPIPGTFSAGTPTERTGTITVRMSFLRPITGADMAAGQAMFEWS
jgi:hypothetical protein